MNSKTVILSAKRTPMTGFQGGFATLTASQLGSNAIRSAIDVAQIESSQISEVYMGNVISAGQGQAPARQASLQAGIPTSVPCTTVSKVCGSGMKAVMMAADFIDCGHGDLVVAGGMESMTNAPYLLDKARAGHRMGHGTIKDAMFLDGLEDAQSGLAMGVFAQKTADDYSVTRKEMDDYALMSLERAVEATEKGYFADEIAPVTVKSRSDEFVVDEDEQLKNAKPDKIPLLRPAFAKEGNITAANSSSISDGAAAMVLASADYANEVGAKAIATIRGHASLARTPENFTIAPAGAIKNVLEKVGWSVNDVDLFEINEAFALVTLLAVKELDLDLAKVNINGGACALGHPLGASGARIIVTLIHALRRSGKSKGVASLCIGGGEATAIAIELAD